MGSEFLATPPLPCQPGLEEDEDETHNGLLAPLHNISQTTFIDDGPISQTESNYACSETCRCEIRRPS